jgi:hypothetical protein
MSITLEILKPLCQREFDPNETLRVLRHNQTIYWSWGVTKLVNVDNKGLLMKVNGHHHKGYVFVTLAYDDTYSVHIISTHGNVKQTFHMVYFDTLTEIIDNRIERIKDYVV